MEPTQHVDTDEDRYYRPIFDGLCGEGYWDACRPIRERHRAAALSSTGREVPSDNEWRKFATHDFGCGINRIAPNGIDQCPCDCGLGELEARFAASRSSVSERPDASAPLPSDGPKVYWGGDTGTRS